MKICLQWKYCNSSVLLIDCIKKIDVESGIEKKADAKCFKPASFQKAIRRRLKKEASCGEVTEVC